MDQGKSKLATALLTAAALTTTAVGTSRAVVYVESGDAGQTLATAQTATPAVNGSTGLTQINGTISTSTDADLFLFTLSQAATLTFTATSTAGIDTSLFLFNSSGVPLLANDDQSMTNYQASFSTGMLAAGTYYIGISLSGNEPVNLNSQLLFTVNQPTTAVRGPASGLNPTTESTFDGSTFVAETGAYSIGISAIPEPTTTAALGLGGVASLVFLRRIRRAGQA